MWNRPITSMMGDGASLGRHLMISTSCQHLDSEPNYPRDCAHIVVWADRTPLASADIAALRPASPR
jgi:hypothetical protein